MKALGDGKDKRLSSENLVVAKIKPDDEDAQAALIRFTKDRLTDVIINQKLNIKVGKCLSMPIPKETSTVSCMILLYNRG